MCLEQTLWQSGAVLHGAVWATSSSSMAQVHAQAGAHHVTATNGLEYLRSCSLSDVTVEGSRLSGPFKPATGRPYVRAFSLSGTVPAFTCDCLRFVCAFTPRPKVDLCVSTFSRTMLAFGNNVSFSSSACSTLAFCRR